MHTEGNSLSGKQGTRGRPDTFAAAPPAHTARSGLILHKGPQDKKGCAYLSPQRREV